MKEHFEDVALSLMAKHSLEAHAGRGLDLTHLRDRITEAQKYRLFTRLDTVFKSWTGESFIAFICRQQANNAARVDGRGGSDG